MKLTNISYQNWNTTKDTVQLFLQIIGKIKLKYSHKRNHWWHITFKLTPKGLTTGIFYIKKVPIELRFDFLSHELEVIINQSKELISLNRISVKDFYGKVFNIFQSYQLDLSLDHPYPFDCNSDIPFEQDLTHVYKNKDKVEEWFLNIRFVNYILQKQQSKFKFKISPVHMFWHSFDLATSLFTGNRGPNVSTTDQVTQDAYSDEVISFGWWPGDHKTEKAAFYSYVHPHPPGLEQIDLSKTGGSWLEQDNSYLAYLPNEKILQLEEDFQIETVLNFFSLVQKNGFKLAKWSEGNLYYKSSKKDFIQDISA